jgi:hypothetical protein
MLVFSSVRPMPVILDISERDIDRVAYGFQLTRLR